ncbi:MULTISPECIES: tyrosine-type recombinase/integrase [Bacillus cereus group]|uniref:tyrosine-type recombinase/integrase n=1 Tax=Bacillus cereus group TaxID=86661 RepID=UPI0001A1D9D8|nr:MULTISPECIES: tyrosine-type recombinase/integrase [Bacillus cereus group]EEM73502.1 Phage integrase [Bacillus thuringiensis serovar andalousiensis BGSC 4AW1]MEB9630920.1 tyrosine-type recombinase/integrase [Bacillus anthracis]OUA94507.1 integrase [Bacillus thuringiensis serovar oswaldocruzi]
MEVGIRMKDFEGIEEFSDDTFDLETSIDISREILEQEQRLNFLSTCKFEDNIWILTKELKQQRAKIDFHSLVIHKGVSEKLLSIIKCWVAYLLEKYKARTVLKHFLALERVILISNVFKLDKIKDIKKEFEEKNSLMRLYNCIAVLNFIDYYSVIDRDGKYIEMFLEIKQGLKVPQTIRKLPPSHDVLKFSLILEDYMVKIEDKNAYYMYFPLYIWWTLSNLIPMRPSEFCSIERDCLFLDDGETYIRLPRTKLKQNIRGIQIIDNIYIPEELYHMISEYIKETQEFGVSETLISYLSIPIKSEKIKLNKKRFTTENLYILLEHFYEDIIFKQYGYTFKPPMDEEENIKPISSPQSSIGKMQISRKIRANDTRHFAFLNLMRQGYHPVEIARLGGHINIQTQYHYHQHTEYWVDTEVLQLMLRFNLQENRFKKAVGLGKTSNIKIDEKFKEKFVLRPAKSEHKKMLDLGYCTDPLQYCQVDECYMCNDWRISESELYSEYHLIELKMRENEKEISNLMHTLRNLHIQAIKHTSDIQYSVHNTTFSKDLKETAKQLDYLLKKKQKLNHLSL